MPLLPFTLKCLPFALKSSRTSTCEITCIYIYTQLKHASFLSELYTFVNCILYVCASVLWVCMRASSLYVCASVYRCVCMQRVYMYMRVFIGVFACSEFICICKLFTSVYAFITNIRCIGMDFILVCTYISYIYIEHPIVYMYMWVIYWCICTCFMYVLISEVWFKSYMAPHR